MDDLNEQSLRAAVAGRPLRWYPAVLSTEADALAWARADAPDGAIVAAGYQASPRGRGGLEWRVDPDVGLGFSLVLRPRLPAAREGWLYLLGSLALEDALGGGELEWPDEVRSHRRRLGAVAVQTSVAPLGVEWAVISFLVEETRPPRAPLLAAVVEAVEAQRARTTAAVLADYLRHCATLGREVRARLAPLGPAGQTLEGRADAVRPDGSLVLVTAGGRRLALRPQGLGVLETL